MANTKIKGRQVEVFDTSNNGVVPAPGTSTGKFLKDDGTWAAGGGGGTTITYGSTPPTGGSDGDIYLQYT